VPIYEYECQKCGAAFEMMQSISAKPVTNCVKAKCGGKARRQVSASGFILKGSGWYTSDYPSEARKQGWKQENCQAGGGSPDATCGKKECPQPAVAPDEKSKPAEKGRPVNCRKKAAKKVKA
jgi:putative FmdB family regulatory protein